jgi:hypothetical protein
MRMFDEFDADGDRELDRAEFRALIGALRERGGLIGPRPPRIDGPGDRPDGRGRRPGARDGEGLAPRRERDGALDGPPGPPPQPGDPGPAGPPPRGRRVREGGDRPPSDPVPEAEIPPDVSNDSSAARLPLRPARDQSF